MANSKRRYIDKNGSMFIPMNVEGGTWNEHFITTPKLITFGAIVFSAIFLGMWLASIYADASSYIIFYTMWAIASFYVTRYIIFEERFYYRMYKQLKESEITTPALFWDIASIKETDEGAILTYSDAKVGIIIKLERDTITGKTPEFKEAHYDAISDFYRELVAYKYSFVQMNIMEQAGNDPRLHELDKLLYKNDNQNICKLMERQIGHIKNITHKTLYESDYVLVYSAELRKMDTIISDTIDCIYKILDGAYIGYRILNSRDIVELIKEEYGVRYFNTTDATLTMFKNRINNTKKPFKLEKIMFNTGETQEIGSRELNKINAITSEVLKGNKDIDDISLKETVLSRENKMDGIDFGSLADDFDFGQENTSNKINNGNKIRNKFEIRKQKRNKNKDNTIDNNIQQSEGLDIFGDIDIDYDDENIDF